MNLQKMYFVTQFDEMHFNIDGDSPQVKFSREDDMKVVACRFSENCFFNRLQVFLKLLY